MSREFIELRNFASGQISLSHERNDRMSSALKREIAELYPDLPFSSDSISPFQICAFLFREIFRRERVCPRDAKYIFHTLIECTINLIDGALIIILGLL